MAQSKAMSLVESVANLGVGYGVSVLANMIVLPAFGYHVSTGHAAAMGVVFSAISLVRSYLLRRAFNRLRPSSPPEFQGENV